MIQVMEWEKRFAQCRTWCAGRRLPWHWFDFLFPPRSDEAILRDVSSDDFLACIAPRLVLGTRPSTVTLFSFGDARVRAAIHEAKYHGSAHAFALLSTTLSEYLREADDIQPKKTSIVPIPLGKGRLRERGFNQTEEIVRRTLRNIGEEGGCLSALESTLLIRVRETASQVSLPRSAREENMRGAFSAAHPANPSQTYIVFDDVITTGATLQAAIDALTEAGAVHIIPLALAH